MAEAEDLEVPSDLNGEHLSNGENREVNVKELQFLSLCILTSVTRLGDFWTSLLTNYLSKVAKMFGNFWGIFKISLLKLKLQWSLFGTT